MAVLKCKMCGATLDVQEGMTVCECEYCGSAQTVPQLDDERKEKLFARANRLRSACEFDKAAGVYETIVADYPEEAEAYWGILLCRFGIEYIDDPKTGKMVPTCHRSSFESIMDDQDFEMVMECSDPMSRAVYREEAKTIELLRTRINEISSKEAPYDIFICYKETDANEGRTIDSVIAQDVYDALVESGYKVFFSRISLEDKLGQEYEPYIFAALNSAKVMLAFGTDYENFNAIWVKNEWSRFLNLIEKGAKKTLIPCFKGVDAYDMPKEFARLQAQDMGKVGAIQDLLRGIGKILGTKKSIDGNAEGDAISTNSFALIQRGNMALEDGDYNRADDYFERALDVDPSDARAYIGKFLAALGLSSLADLEDKVCLIEGNNLFKRAEQFAAPDLKKELHRLKEYNELKIQKLRLIDVLKKSSKERVKKYLYDSKKAACEQMMSNTAEGEKKARNIYSDMLTAGIISMAEYNRLIGRIPINQGVINVLGDCKVHSASVIGKEDALHYYPSTDISEVLRDLVDYDLIKQKHGEYSLKDAKERRKREMRQKAAFDEACATINRQIQEDIRLITSQLFDDYDSRLSDLQTEIEGEIIELNRQRESLRCQISDWSKQMSSLGIFKGKEKKALQVRIDEANNQLCTLPTQQQIRANHQPEIDRINAEKQAEYNRVLSEVRSRYTMPKIEDFVENEIVK